MKAKLRSALLAPALAIAFSAVLCAVALLISGANPADALVAMVSQVGELNIAVNIVNAAAVYSIAAVAAAIGFKMNLLNIGIEGQYWVAGIVAAIVGASVTLPGFLHVPVILVTAMVTGALWVAVPAILKVTRGVHEVISTIMLNGIAIGLVAYLITTQNFGVLHGNEIFTEDIPESGWVSGFSIGGEEIYGLIVLAVLVSVVYWFALTYTRFGFELTASGGSLTAAAAGGVNAKRMIMVALLVSGAVAGLIAMPEILGAHHRFSTHVTQGIGFSGLAIALLGRNHPVGIWFGALLWAFLDKSKLALDDVGVPQEIATIMQGTIVMSVVIAYEVVRRFDVKAEQRRVGRALGRTEPVPATTGGDQR